MGEKNSTRLSRAGDLVTFSVSYYGRSIELWASTILVLFEDDRDVDDGTGPPFAEVPGGSGEERSTMNSYPPELLAQLAPVMFVAGLDASPNPQDPAAQGTPPKPQDPFTVLKYRLREALISQRKVAIWQPEKAKVFQAVLVETVSARKFMYLN